MVSSKEKSSEEEEKEVSNTIQKSNKNNDKLIVVEIDHQNIEELEPNGKEDVILERFSLYGGFLVIGPFNAVLNELGGNIFFGFTIDGEVHLWVAILDFFLLITL